MKIANNLIKYHQNFQALEHDNDNKGKVEYSQPHFIEREKEAAKQKFKSKLLIEDEFGISNELRKHDIMMKKLEIEGQKIVKLFQKLSAKK